MAKLFLSYSRDDSDRAAALVDALQHLGHSLWWDRQVEGGSRFSHDIERELKCADVVLVLWSRASVDSTWVHDEATEGRDSGRLIPVTIDDIKPPLGFRQFQAIDLSGWNGRPDWPGIQKLNRAILARTGSGAPPPAQIPPPASVAQVTIKRHPSPRAWALLAFATVALAGLLAWVVYHPGSKVSPLKVQLADFKALSPGVPASAPQDLREELLGALAIDSMIMASDQKADQGQASLLVGGTVRKLQNSLRFAIRLTNARTGNAIWSTSVERPLSIADIAPRQVAVGASQVLRCGLGGAATYGHPMPDETLSLYLNYCDVWADLDGKGPNHERAMDLARRLTREVPDFSKAWSAFAQQAANSRTDSLVNNDAITAEAVAAAKRALAIDKDNSEAYQALARLQPRTAFAAREKLHRKSVEVRPGDCGCEYMDYGLFLSEVGRNSEAADSFKRAHDMLPLSLDVNAVWAESLYIADRPNEAEPVIRDLRALWPDAPYLRATVIRVAFWTKRYDAALSELSSSTVDLSEEERSALRLALLALKAGNTAMVARARVALRPLASKPAADLTMLLPALGATGGPDEALKILETSIDAGNRSGMLLLFEPTSAPVRQSPRYAGMVKRYGFLGYWRQSGRWPDFCKATDAPAFCKRT